MEGFWVRDIDLKLPDFSETEADYFIAADLRDAKNCLDAVDRRFDEVCQLAADMGGGGCFFPASTADIMHNSVMINLNILEACKNQHIDRILFFVGLCLSSLQSIQRCHADHA